MNPIHIRTNTGEEDGGAGQGHLEGPCRGGAGEVKGRGLLRVPRRSLHVICVHGQVPTTEPNVAW